MEIPATKENRVLASAVNARIKADARLHNAQAIMYRMAGYGSAAALFGAGLGAALYGYAATRGPASDAAVVADAVAKAMAGLTLKTEGVVKLDPESRLAVGSRPDVPTPTPTPAQLGTDAAPASRAAVATNFTVFKNVPFGQGAVVTGWNYTASDQARPAHQYCYFTEQLDGASKVTIDLGENGKQALVARTRPGVDLAAAYANCVWFKNGAT